MAEGLDRSRRRCRARDGGFTLLEAMVAFVLVAFVLGAAYASISAAGASSVRAEMSLAALTRAEAALAEIGVVAPLERGVVVSRDGSWTTTVTVEETLNDRDAMWRRLGRRPYLVTAEVVADGASAGAALSLKTLRAGPYDPPTERAQ